MAITLQSSSGEIKIVLSGDQEDLLRTQVARFLQEMTQTGQNGAATPPPASNGHRTAAPAVRSVPAEIIGRTGYPLYPG